MNTQPEALMKLADAYADASFTQGLEQRTEDPAPERAREALEAELRRLHGANQELLEALKSFVAIAQEAHEHWDEDRDVKVGKILLALAGSNQRYDKRIDAIHAAIAKGEQA